MSVTGYMNRSVQKGYVLTTYDRVNTSPTQQKFTFGKADRFPAVRKPECPVVSYDPKD